VIQPKIVLILGTVALRAVLGGEAGIMKSRGVWQQWQGIPVMPTFHPAYLLRNGADKRLTFKDLKAVAARYDAEGGLR
jgi:DNA polymerase